MKRVVLFLTILVLAGCNPQAPSTSIIQTAIAQTQTSQQIIQPTQSELTDPQQSPMVLISFHIIWK